LPDTILATVLVKAAVVAVVWVVAERSTRLAAVDQTATFVEGINHLAACCTCQLITVGLKQHSDSCFD
jgi:hypothetical protein